MAKVQDPPRRGVSVQEAPLGTEAVFPTNGAAQGDCSQDYLKLACVTRPDLSEFVSQIALDVGERHVRPTTVTYDRALVWLGVEGVRREFQTVTNHAAQGRAIGNLGAVLTARLHAKARAATGYNLLDLSLNGHDVTP